MMTRRAPLLICFLASLSWADAPGRLAGQVVDGSGAAIAGAFVTARHLTLARETTVYADADGRWALPPLEAGTYHLRARRSGFRDRTEVVEIAEGAAGS